ncbi:MAG: cobaltochelatase subunit CobT [Rhodomicrobium sp.]|nr:MAG: cobaltochelatase subunit CobT [Rhodomicrobium sp.]
MAASNRPNSKASEKFRTVLRGACRAIAGDNELEVSLGTDGPVLLQKRIILPDVPDNGTVRDVQIRRGFADSLSLKASCHNGSSHDKNKPADAEARMIYNALEEVRYEAIGARRMSGMADNLMAKEQRKIEGQFLEPITCQDDVPMHLALSLLAREALTGQRLTGKADEITTPWRGQLEEKAAPIFSKLEGELLDQTAYAERVMELLKVLNISTQKESGEEEETLQDSDAPSDEAETSNEADDDAPGQDEAEADDSDGADEPDGGEREEAEAPDSSISEGEAENQAKPAQQQAGMPNVSVLDAPEIFGYKTYTKQFDEECQASDLAQENELARLRKLLDRQLETLNRAVARLANRLQRKLLAQQNRSWEFDLEEGVLDASRLSRVVTDPMAPLSFRREADTEFRDTVVTLLIDNSGSMRGRPIMIAACSADILARTLERCGVKVEILGFTTKAWKGGDARQVWEEHGKPQLPGRLNDLRHIIYKNADTPWRRASDNLGLMMREGLLKENIDGEALTWAHKRLLARPEQRRILMVISDGAPVDDSTLSVNPGNYLEQHLCKVIDEIESRSPIELIAIGIGHDVTRYYQRAVTITDAEDLAGAMTDKLSELFDEEPRAAARPQRRRR